MSVDSRPFRRESLDVEQGPVKPIPVDVWCPSSNALAPGRTVFVARSPAPGCTYVTRARAELAAAGLVEGLEVGDAHGRGDDGDDR
ncbi:hypothetical protein GCM10010339_59190 [Streptomyces alanosinicus]|uniref:Uncharacterized protein n=1 Tax=Streptomyces alanosinicus TaxID=68171 RepID=A0A918YNE2_9ACTN|nr:hypothetical protein GCM10010339_59190 [Streptomyces alanosinicus]